MPYVKIELVERRTEDQKAALAQAVTNALVEHTGARAETVWVVIDDVRKENWASGGKLLSQR